MAEPSWLDLAAKLSEIVGALVAIVSLVRDVLGKGRRESHPEAGLESSVSIPRGWLRASVGLFCIPLLALVLQTAGFTPTAFRAIVDVAAAAAGLAALLAFGMHVIRLRRQRLPLPDGLLALLDGQYEDSQNHPYAFFVGSAPPILEIYVDQWTERRARTRMEDGSDAGIPLTIKQMLEKSRNVIVLADPGAGKSTAINQVLGQQSDWWRQATRSTRTGDAPYGSYMPIMLPADLHGCHRLPDAMARQWEQVTGLKGDPRVFGRKPPFAQAWLVLIDGIDHILSTPARTDVLARVGGWAANTSAPYRFMITSRPLLSGELGPLKAEYVGQYTLRKFDDEELEQFARRWAAFRETQHFDDMDVEPFTAARFMSAIKAASLEPVARVPLIATITALILEDPNEAVLPGSLAGLYERFVQHLFSSRHLDQLKSTVPAQFALHGRRGQRAWAWLLDNLRDLLEGVADQHRSVRSLTVGACAVRWIRANAPPGMFEAVPGWDDALSGLLTATSLIVQTKRGLDFAHPNFEEYLAAGPRGRVFDLETWLADMRSPDSRSFALFLLARQARERPAEQGPGFVGRLAELLLDRGGAEACLAGDIIAAGIEIAPALRLKIVDALFDQLERDDETTEALGVLVKLVGDGEVMDRLIRFSADPVQHDWSRTDAAEELCVISRDTGTRLLRQILEGTADSLLRHRILLRLAAMDAVTTDERLRAGRYESELAVQGPASSGARAGYGYRQIASEEANEPGRRLHAALAMAERGDHGWDKLFHAIIIDPRLSEDARLDAGRRAMRLADGAGSAALRRVTNQADSALEVRVPLLAVMAEAQDEQARRALNQLNARGGADFRRRFPFVAAWREEIGTRSSEQPDQVVPSIPGGSFRAPEIWGRVPQRNKNFIGRAGILARLREGSASRMSAIATERDPGDDPMPQAVQGLGGVGKTAIAIEYAYRYRSDYDLVWWIPADQVPLVRVGLASLAAHIGLEDATTAGIDGATEAVLDALRRGIPFSRWLLIFDNADQPEDIIDFIPRGPGTVLVTSRNHRWKSVIDAVSVDVFTRSESIEFLGRRTDGLITSDAEPLADALGDLPLALEQAGTMLAETGMGVGEYLRRLDEHAAVVMSEGKSVDYPLSMTAAWTLSTAIMRQQLPEALELLRVCAFLGREPIPTDILRQGGAAASGVSMLLADPILLARSIRELSRFALIKLDGRSITVHRLIQALIRDELSPDERAHYRHDAHLILASAAPIEPGDPSTWARYRELLPHAAADACELERCHDPKVRAFALNVLGYLWQAGDPLACLRLADRFVTRWAQDSGPDDPATLGAYYHRSAALRLLGRYPEARRATDDALSRAESALGPEDSLTIALMASSAEDLRAVGDFASALSLDQENRARCEEAYGPEHPQTLRALNGLALDLGLNGDYRAARELSQRAFYWAKSSDPALSNTEIFMAWLNLAWVLRLDGSFLEARDVIEEALDYARESLGLEHYVTLRAGTELSIARRCTGRLDESTDLARTITDQSRKTFGDAHPIAIAAVISLANSLTATGRELEALELTEDAVAHCIEVYGPTHPLTYGCTGNLGLLRRLTGDPDTARRLDEAALAGLCGRLDPGHYYSLTVAMNLASDLAMLGDHAKAHELGQDTLTRSRQALGQDHPLTLGCAANLVMDLRILGLTDDADQLATDTKNRLTQTLGPDHHQTVMTAAQSRLSFSFDPPVGP